MLGFRYGPKSVQNHGNIKPFMRIHLQTAFDNIVKAVVSRVAGQCEVCIDYSQLGRILKWMSLETQVINDASKCPNVALRANGII